MVEKNKITDIKKADQDRRTELAMMGLLIDKYPKEAVEKTRKPEPGNYNNRSKHIPG